MIGKNQRGEHGANKDCFSDLFPVGMRVLAVDDDQVCLKVLEKMLMECRYHVTTTTQSTKALEMLREDKNKFDLVISDVNMPDMDGFKLLEIVGLEMDLPVIMLSAHKDINLVKKGVLHGACDYLLKPCRMEELQNIWQHVFRRKIDFKELNKASIIEDKVCNMVREDSQGIASENNADDSKKRGKRVKEEGGEEGEEEDDDENDQEDEEHSTRKKPRLLWVNELHRKFVAAVNQLGLERAVPKKILDLMNVEGLTRENVASHLQKYRLGLRKAAEQASTVGLGSSDPYLQMSSLDPYSSGSGRFSCTAPPSHVSAGVFSNLNSSPSFNMRGMSSSVMVRHDQSQTMNDSLKAHGSIHPSMFSANQSTNLLQGIPSSIEVNQFQQSNYRAGIRQPRPTESSSIFTVPSVYTKSRTAFGNGNSYQSCFSSNHMLFQGNSPSPHNSVAFRNHSPLGPVKTDSPDRGVCGASNTSMQNAAQLSKFYSNSLPPTQAFNNGQLPQNSFKFSSPTSQMIIPFEESRGGIQFHEGLIGSIVQASYNNLQQSCQQQHKPDYNKNKNQAFNSLVSSNGGTSSLGHNSNQNNTNEMNASLDGQQNEAAPPTNQCPKLEKLCSDARMKSNDDACNLEGMESQEGVNESDFESLDYILGDMVKPEEQQGILFMNEELVFDADPVESCV